MFDKIARSNEELHWDTVEDLQNKKQIVRNELFEGDEWQSKAYSSENERYEVMDVELLNNWEYLQSNIHKGIQGKETSLQLTE